MRAIATTTPNHLALLPLTPIDLLLGKYPFVSPHVATDAAAVAVSPARGSLQLETISSEARFARLAPDWDALVRAMRRPSPFLLHCWLAEWWRHYGDGCGIAVQAAFRDGRLVAALPLITYSRHGLTVATFFGGRQTAPADILLAEEEDPAVVTELLARASAAHDYADLFGLPADCRLAEACGPSELQLFERIEAPTLDMSDGWDAAYRANTNGKKRAHHRHRRRQLASLGSLEVSFARTVAELEPVLEEAFRLHEHRWQGRADGSGFVTPTGKRFSRAVLGALAEIDVARMVTLSLDGKTIAFVWYLALERTMYLHRIAFDPQFARFSPGLVNTLNALELAAAEGVTRVEFLGGADRYKLELADRFEPLHLGLGLPGSSLGRIVVAARTRWLRFRRLAKQSGTVRALYDRTGSVRRRVTRPRNVLRPSGAAHAGE
jgi:CelD/BcsL family acetyltransferase involved in cellulose biosynthesis